MKSQPVPVQGDMDPSNQSEEGKRVPDANGALDIKDDVLFQELLNESRRYRDRTLDIVKWFTTITLAIVGGIFSLYQLDKPLLLENKRIFIALIIAQWLAVSCLIFDSSRRFRSVRDEMKKIKLKVKLIRRKSPLIAPSFIYLIYSFFITSLVVIFLWTL